MKHPFSKEQAKLLIVRLDELAKEQGKGEFTIEIPIGDKQKVVLHRWEQVNILYGRLTGIDFLGQRAKPLAVKEHYRDEDDKYSAPLPHRDAKGFWVWPSKGYQGA